jgi:RimJ/RimL family protein N-acetyltransferase
LELLSEEFLSLCLAREFAQAEMICGFKLHSAWFAREDFIRRRRDQYRSDPEFAKWGVQAILLQPSRQMAGYIGFHESPDPPHLRTFGRNAVEFGYTIYPEYRRSGYATEALGALMKWCTQQPGIDHFVLSIAPSNAPSQAVAQRYGFQKVGEHMDELDGLEDVLLLPVSKFQAT